MIRQSAFENTGNAMLKGALHCHTTRSDGKGSPDEVIRMHKRNGYDFMALTDHRIYNYMNFAPDAYMLIIPGMEMDGNFTDNKPGCVHCIHEVCIGCSREDGNGFEQNQRFVSARFEKAEEFQPVLDMMHENKNMTFYCHPEWSGTPARDFENLKGNFGMEIWNSGCAMEDDMDTDAAYWDELLRQGIRLWGLATDDGHAMRQHCNGWVRVNAARDINSILESLREGRFYASTGPEIYDFYVNDEGIAVVDCSPVVKIRYHYGYAPNRIRRPENTQTFTHAEFKVPDSFTYIRASVVDAEGHIAWTQPIFFDKPE